MPVVSHEWKIEYSVLMDVRSLRVFEEKVLKVCGRNWEEASGGIRKLHNEEIHNLYCSLNFRVQKSRRMRCV